jgi:regulator of protease activity HflC (stomatin/prohibitin superfamily)
VMVSAGCRKAAPDPGQEAVKVRKPWIFGHGGVDRTPVKTGMSWVAPRTDIWYVVMQPQQFIVHFEDLMSRDGVPLDFDASVRLQVTDSVSLVEKFGVQIVEGTGKPAWYFNVVEQPFRTIVRQAVRKHGLNETAIDSSAIEAIDTEVTAAMKAQLDTAGLPVKLLDLTVGRANPPDSVKHQRVETAAQEQRANTEKQRKLAEDQRLAAEQARAAADNAYREAMRLTPEQFLQLEQIKMLNSTCGGGKCTFLLGSGAVPTLSVK